MRRKHNWPLILSGLSIVVPLILSATAWADYRNYPNYRSYPKGTWPVEPAQMPPLARIHSVPGRGYAPTALRRFGYPRPGLVSTRPWGYGPPMSLYPAPAVPAFRPHMGRWPGYAQGRFARQTYMAGVYGRSYPMPGESGLGHGSPGVGTEAQSARPTWAPAAPASASDRVTVPVVEPAPPVSFSARTVADKEPPRSETSLAPPQQSVAPVVVGDRDAVARASDVEAATAHQPAPLTAEQETQASAEVQASAEEAFVSSVEPGEAPQSPPISPAAPLPLEQEGGTDRSAEPLASSTKAFASSVEPSEGLPSPATSSAATPPPEQEAGIGGSAEPHASDTKALTSRVEPREGTPSPTASSAGPVTIETESVAKVAVSTPVVESPVPGQPVDQGVAEEAGESADFAAMTAMKPVAVVAEAPQSAEPLASPPGAQPKDVGIESGKQRKSLVQRWMTPGGWLTSSGGTD